MDKNEKIKQKEKELLRSYVDNISCNKQMKDYEKCMDEYHKNPTRRKILICQKLLKEFEFCITNSNLNKDESVLNESKLIALKSQVKGTSPNKNFIEELNKEFLKTESQYKSTKAKYEKNAKQ